MGAFLSGMRALITIVFGAAILDGAIVALFWLIGLK